jgi:hypothetical protein
MHLLLAVVDQVSLLLDRVEERVRESVLGGDALVGVKLQHALQEVNRVGSTGGETLTQVLWAGGVRYHSVSMQTLTRGGEAPLAREQHSCVLYKSGAKNTEASPTLSQHILSTESTNTTIQHNRTKQRVTLLADILLLTCGERVGRLLSSCAVFSSRWGRSSSCGVPITSKITLSWLRFLPVRECAQA